MKEVEPEIKFSDCQKSHHFDSKGLSSLQARALIKDDIEATKQYYYAQTSRTKQTPVDNQYKEEFERLVKEWVSAIRYKSIESQQVNHPAFFRIIAIGDKVKPSVFEEFSKRPFVAWLRALPAIIGVDIASEAENFPEAVRLWIEWGKENDYLPK